MSFKVGETGSDSGFDTTHIWALGLVVKSHKDVQPMPDSNGTPGPTPPPDELNSTFYMRNFKISGK